MQDKIIVKQIKCYTQIGVADNERAIGQNLLIEISAYLDLSKAGLVDELESTISYVEISKAVQITCKKRAFKILENLACNICQDILGQFSVIQALEVEVHKPHIPNPQFIGQASVFVFRSRNSE